MALSSSERSVADRSASEHPLSDQSTAELIRRAADQVSTLVRDEIALAKAEVAVKARHAGLGAGLLGGAGVIALYGLAGVLTAAVLALSHVIPAWLSALLVGVLLLVLAGVLALVGRGQFKQAVPPVPSEAVQGVKSDIAAVTSAVEERGGRG